MGDSQQYWQKSVSQGAKTALADLPGVDKKWFLGQSPEAGGAGVADPVNMNSSAPNATGVEEPTPENPLPLNVQGYEDLDIWQKDNNGGYMTFTGADGNTYARYNNDLFDIDQQTGKISAWDPNDPSSQKETEYIWAYYPELVKQGFDNVGSWVDFQRLGNEGRQFWDPLLVGSGFDENDWRSQYARNASDQLQWVREHEDYWGDNGQFDLDKYWDYKNRLNTNDFTNWTPFDVASLVGQNLSYKDIQDWSDYLVNQAGWKPYTSLDMTDETFARVQPIFAAMKGLNYSNDDLRQYFAKTAENYRDEENSEYNLDDAALFEALSHISNFNEGFNGDEAYYLDYSNDELEQLVRDYMIMSVLNQDNFSYIDQNPDLATTELNRLLAGRGDSSYRWVYDSNPEYVNDFTNDIPSVANPYNPTLEEMIAMASYANEHGNPPKISASIIGDSPRMRYEYDPAIGAYASNPVSDLIAYFTGENKENTY